jgi:GT2 family glycosyltransferase
MKIFTIVVTYNGMHWYERCFGSLKNSVVPVQIVAVDNASSDGTVDYIKKHYTWITLIESEKNLGFAKANNLGLRYALDHGADYVFLLNQDAWINQPETIATLIHLSKNHPEYSILSPLQLYGSGKKIEHETLMHFARHAKSNNDFISDLYLGDVKDIYNVPYACAVCWLLPVRILNEIGGFDPLFYHYGEDDNFIQRVKYFGYQVGICPRVSISHDIESRTNDYRDKDLDWRKYLLINLGNINSELDISSILRSKLKVIFIQLLRMNRKLLKKSLAEYLYLRKMKEPLEYSRAQNKIKRTNWL